MLGKITRCVIVPFLSFSILCAAGFCIWVFSDEVSSEIVLPGDILLEEKVEFGKAVFVNPLDLDYQEYRIIFEQEGHDVIYDETKGINLVPSLQFDFSNYHLTGKLEKPAEFEGYQFHYYFDFALDDKNTNYDVQKSVFFRNDSYGEYMTKESAQSFETRKVLEVDWTSETTRVKFSPVFHYRDGKKPGSSEVYQQMLTDIYNDTNVYIFTLYITFEKEV